MQKSIKISKYCFLIPYRSKFCLTFKRWNYKKKTFKLSSSLAFTKGHWNWNTSFMSHENVFCFSLPCLVIFDKILLCHHPEWFDIYFDVYNVLTLHVSLTLFHFPKMSIRIKGSWINDVRFFWVIFSWTIRIRRGSPVDSAEDNKFSTFLLSFFYLFYYFTTIFCEHRTYI